VNKIPSGTPESAWHKASAVPASSAATHSAPRAASNLPATNTPRTDLTRYIPSASPLAMAVYAEAAVQRQENNRASEVAAAPADCQPPRSLAELPYLAHPHHVKSGRRASGANLAGAKDANASGRTSNSASPSLNGHVWRYGKWILLAVAVLMLLMMWRGG
jgi:hypothetical protein